MATISKKTLEFVKRAYKELKDDTSPYACFIQYREGNERYIDYMMQKESWYFSKWSLFENGHYVISFEEEFLKYIED